MSCRRGNYVEIIWALWQFDGGSSFDSFLLRNVGNRASIDSQHYGLDVVQGLVRISSVGSSDNSRFNQNEPGRCISLIQQQISFNVGVWSLINVSFIDYEDLIESITAGRYWLQSTFNVTVTTGSSSEIICTLLLCLKCCFVQGWGTSSFIMSEHILPITVPIPPTPKSWEKEAIWTNPRRSIRSIPIATNGNQAITKHFA